MYFWIMENVDRSHPYPCATIPGTRLLHSIRTTNRLEWTIQLRNHSCVCLACTEHDFLESYDNQSLGYVEQWRDYLLTPLPPFAPDAKQQIESDECTFSIDYDMLSDFLSEGEFQLKKSLRFL